MFVYNRFLGSLINKLTWFVLIAIIGLVCFFGGLWVANAETCTSLNITGTSATFTTSTNEYIGDYYSHDKIRDDIPVLLNNNQDFTNYYGTYSLYNFYQRFNYAVLQQDNEYFRVFYQDIDFLESVSCANVDNKFYIGSFFSTSNYNYNLNIPYSFYIDIHFDLSDNSIILDSISTLSDNLNALSLNNRKFSSYPSWSSWTFNIPLIDSYNGLQLLNNIETTAYELYIESLNSYFNNRFPDIAIINSNNTNINELSLAFSGSEITEPDEPENPDPENPGGFDDSAIRDQLQNLEEGIGETNSILDGIADSFTNFREAVAGGFNTIGEKIQEGNNLLSDTLESITDWFSGIFDDSSLEEFINDYSEEDNGGISQIVISPIRLIQAIDNDSCEPLRFEVMGKEVAMPSGCILWQHSPEEITLTYHIFVYGFISYRLLVSLYYLIEELKDPQKREVDTLQL